MIAIGIDIGTQSLKVVLLDGERIVARGTGHYQLMRPKPTWVEQDPLAWEQALGEAVASVLHTSRLDKNDIETIGVAGQLDGCIAVDSKCQPLSQCLVWMDRRAHCALPDLSESECEEFRQRTGQVMDSSHMAAKISWLKRNALSPLDAGSVRFHQPTSFLVERLCGVSVMDPALASTTMLCGLSDGDYDDRLLEYFAVSRQELPGISPADSVAGTLTRIGAKLSGLAVGTPVAVGTGDDFATPLGAGVVSPGTMFCVLGTAEVVGTLSTSATIDPGGLVETHRFLDDYLLENPGWLSGGSLRWLGQILLVESDAALDRLASESPVGCDGLSFLPALTGAMAPEWQPKARGCFYGLTSHHGRSHMARAVLEGCAFAMRDVRDRLDGLGLKVDPIILLGGGAHSELWAQMRSDLCQVRVLASDNDDSCALGAAFLARAAIGEDTARNIAQCWPRVFRKTTPEPNRREKYEEAYDRYRRLFEATRTMWTSRD